MVACSNRAGVGGSAGRADRRWNLFVETLRGAPKPEAIQRFRRIRGAASRAANSLRGSVAGVERVGDAAAWPAGIVRYNETRPKRPEAGNRWNLSALKF